jgi:hypothetical protein
VEHLAEVVPVGGEEDRGEVDESEAEEAEADGGLRVADGAHVLEVAHEVSEVLVHPGHAALARLGVAGYGAEGVDLFRQRGESVVDDVGELRGFDLGLRRRRALSQELDNVLDQFVEEFLDLLSWLARALLVPRLEHQIYCEYYSFKRS